MKITMQNGKCIAECETVQDIVELTKYVTAQRMEKTGRPRGKVRAKTCRDCGRQYHYLKAHLRYCKGRTVPLDRIV